jgi:hypothetical protein
MKVGLLVDRNGPAMPPNWLIINGSAASTCGLALLHPPLEQEFEIVSRIDSFCLGIPDITDKLNF